MNRRFTLHVVNAVCILNTTNGQHMDMYNITWSWHINTKHYFSIKTHTRFYPTYKLNIVATWRWWGCTCHTVHLGRWHEYRLPANWYHIGGHTMISTSNSSWTMFIIYRISAQKEFYGSRDNGGWSGGGAVQILSKYSHDKYLTSGKMGCYTEV